MLDHTPNAGQIQVCSIFFSIILRQELPGAGSRRTREWQQMETYLKLWLTSTFHWPKQSQSTWPRPKSSKQGITFHLVDYVRY